jgi:sulfate transport system permease protein
VFPALTKQRSALPGFRITLGYSLLYLGLIVLVPLSGAIWKSSAMSWPAFWGAVASPRVLASYRLTFGASLIAAGINAAFGLLVAWVLVRYRFPFKRVVDAFVDLPFALPSGFSFQLYYLNTAPPLSRMWSCCRFPQGLDVQNSSFFGSTGRD